MSHSYLLALINSGVCGILAMAAVCRRRQSIAQWAFALGILLLGARSLCDAWTHGAVHLPEIHQAQLWSLAAVGLLPAPWLLFSLSYSRGNAREFIRRWAWALAAFVLVPTGLILGWSHDMVTAVEPPAMGQPTIIELGRSGVLLHAFVLISMVAITMNLERTYRASVGTLRWRIKYMLLGLAVLNSVQFYMSSQAVLFHGTTTSLQVVRSVALLVACLLMGRSFMRPGQFSIDLHPSHGALYGSITLLLAGAYLLIVGLLARFVAFIGGDAAFPLRALVVFFGLVGLAIVLQSDRARLALRHFVSRHFQRPLFDYRTLWQRFAEGMAAGTDSRTISRSAVALVAKSFEIQSASLWLANSSRDTLSLAASTLLDANTQDAAAAPIHNAAAAITHFEAHPQPIDLETSDAPGASDLRDHHRSQFPKGGHRLCVPLVARHSLVGLLVLGDRVGGLPYAPHDFEMFRCVGDHVAAALLSAQLSQDLAQAREFEAFQTMATFFVHDLKNAANTLSLLLQNLPEHFNDPEFREDAIKSCSRTVDHINLLISKLGSLRGGLSVAPVPTDLSALVETNLADWPPRSPVALVRDLTPALLTPLDAESFSKVISNLVINAREATPPGGSVRVATFTQGNRAILRVADTGCGMSAEFIQRSLFRPFQTTKKQGIGIGMFQSRMITEAHRGRIHVSSQPGKGTTFEVSLPTGH